MDFLDDEDKMQDYFKLTKDEFLKNQPLFLKNRG